MQLRFTELSLRCSSVSTLVRDGDELLDVTSQARWAMDGSTTPRTQLLAYPFDRAVGIHRAHALWSVVYENRGTKGILIKDGQILRELNRTYYFAKMYDYLITLTPGQDGRVLLVHCPTSFDILEIEDAETGSTLATKKTDRMEFHSRLAVSPDGRYLLDAGWFWHPLGGAWVCDLGAMVGQSSGKPDVSFSFGAEIDSAAFLGEDAVVVTSTDEVCNEETPPSGLAGMRLGLYSLVSRRWLSIAELREPAGMIMPWQNWVISFYTFPKAIEIATGQVVYEWRHLRSGQQTGAIKLGEPPPPPIAVDATNGRFAIATGNEITVVTLAVE